MKRFFIPIILVLSIVFVVLVGFLWWRENLKAVSSEKTLVRFVIPRGRTAQEIGEMLYEKKLIRSSLAFKIYIQLTDRAKNIAAGEFQLSPSMTLPEIVEAFSKGPLQLWVTIPEGLRKEEVVERVIEGLAMEEAKSSVFRKEFLGLAGDAEGYLFPDTYLFPRDVTTATVVAIMRENFDRKLVSLGDAAVKESSYSLPELVTLASIIERETKTDEERPIVAGILFSRLGIGMALQTDAAVQYAVANSKLKTQNSKLEKFWEPLTKEDLQVDSPYNTYKYRGLPPAPIANPGLSSLKAVINPTETDYLYYLHDKEGKIHYAKTFSEHNQNVREFLGK